MTSRLSKHQHHQPGATMGGRRRISTTRYQIRTNGNTLFSACPLGHCICIFNFKDGISQAILYYCVCVYLRDCWHGSVYRQLFGTRNFPAVPWWNDIEKALLYVPDRNNVQRILILAMPLTNTNQMELFLPNTSSKSWSWGQGDTIKNGKEKQHYTNMKSDGSKTVTGVDLLVSTQWAVLIDWAIDRFIDWSIALRGKNSIPFTPFPGVCSHEDVPEATTQRMRARSTLCVEPFPTYYRNMAKVKTWKVLKLLYEVGSPSYSKAFLEFLERLCTLNRFW